MDILYKGIPDGNGDWRSVTDRKKGYISCNYVAPLVSYEAKECQSQPMECQSQSMECPSDSEESTSVSIETQHSFDKMSFSTCEDIILDENCDVFISVEETCISDAGIVALNSSELVVAQSYFVPIGIDALNFSELVLTQGNLLPNPQTMTAESNQEAGLKLPTQATDSEYNNYCLPRMDSFPIPPKVVDVLKQAGCFVLGEIQTITISDTGGEWNLYPFPDDKKETCAMLSAPLGVVASGKTVVIMYGVIPSGPFVFPDGLKLASVLIYLDCNDKEKLQKPMSLSLKHCITGDDKVLQNSLCFVKASHTPQDGSFVFKSKSNAIFDSKSGTLEFKDFCLKGICVEKACKEIEKISTRCYAIPCKIQLHPTSREYYEYRICLVFGLPSWENVFREYYWTRSEYSREVYSAQEVEFKADKPIQSYVNETDMNGNGWQLMKLCDSVEFTDLEKALLKFNKTECERIIGELEVGLIFPHVRYVITFDKEPNTETHSNRAVCVTLRGCNPKDPCFYIFVKEELRRIPEGAVDIEGPSQANLQQSPIGGFVPPGTFGNEFLDRTPSDAGLLEVVDKIQLAWRRIAILLGVPGKDVNAFESDQDLGGLKALQQWRDGREGCTTPSTWNTLLTVVKDKLGDVVHADLKREVMTHESWSIRRY